MSLTCAVSENLKGSRDDDDHASIGAFIICRHDSPYSHRVYQTWIVCLQSF